MKNCDHLTTLCHLESRKTIHVDVVLVLDEGDGDDDERDRRRPFRHDYSPTKKKNGKGEHSEKVLRSSSKFGLL